MTISIQRPVVGASLFDQVRTFKSKLEGARDALLGARIGAYHANLQFPNEGPVVEFYVPHYQPRPGALGALADLVSPRTRSLETVKTAAEAFVKDHRLDGFQGPIQVAVRFV